MKPLYYIVLSILIGILFISFFLLRARENISTENTFAKPSISNFITPQILFEEKLYEILDNQATEVKNPDANLAPNKDRHILGLAFISLVHRLDPIFAFESVEIENLSGAIRKLSTSTEIFSRFYEPDEKHTIESSLYPITFLEKLPNLEKLRREVTNQPSEENITAYHRKLQSVLEEYRNYLENLKSLFSSFLKEEGNRSTNNIGGVSSNQNVLSFLESLRISTLLNLQKLSDRQRCLTHYDTECAALVKINKDDMVVETDVRLGETPKIIKTIEFIVEETLKNKTGYQRPSNTPLIVLQNSFCFPNELNVFYYVVWKKNNDSVASFRAELLNDMYFYDVQRLNLKNPSEYFRLAKESGIDYLQQSITNLYMCPNQARDISTLSTIYTIRSILLETPLFLGYEQIDTDEELSLLQELEEEITNTHILSESTIRKYLSELSRLLHENSERELASIFSEERVLFMGKLLNISNQNSAQLDEILLSLIDNNNFLEEILGSGNKIILNDLFTSRGYLTATLLAHNNTVTLDNSLSFLKGEQMSLDAIKLVSYNDVLSEFLSPEQIIEIISKRPSFLMNSN